MKKLFARVVRATAIPTLFTCLCFVLYSCEVSRPTYKQLAERNAQLEYQNDVRARQERAIRARKQEIKMNLPYIREASNHLATALMKHFAPMSGSEPGYKVFEETIESDEGLIVAKVRLSFLARDFWKGIGKGTCELTGIVTIQLPQSSYDRTRAFFQWTDRNKQIVAISKSQDWDALKPYFEVSY